MSQSLNIVLDQSGEPLYLQIAAALRAAILRGDLDRDPRLPTTRDLARSLAVNRHTIVSAYRKLIDWDLARSHVGRGTFAIPASERSAVASPVAPRRDVPPAAPPLATASSGERRRAAAPPPWAGVFSKALDGHSVGTLAAAYSVDVSEGRISFAGSFPAAEMLPSSEFRRALDRALRKQPRALFCYGAPGGYTPLREWIAEDMSRAGSPTSPEEILVTNGSQQAIDLVARAFTDPGDLVLLEDPTYTGAISTFQSFGARLSGLPLDGEGVMPGAVSAAAGRTGAKLLYTTPTFQNPTSAVLPLDRRKALLSEAASANLLVVEDDWASGLRFEGEDLPSLRALDHERRVIYLSTFAKKSLPGLRIGWIAAARPIIERLTMLKQINDCCTSPLIQSALTEFLRAGALDRHLPRVRTAYRLRRDRMIAALARHFPEGSTWTRPEGGLFLWVRLPGSVEGALVAADAERKGVLVSRGEVFHVGAGPIDGGAGRGFLRLTFASATPEEIDRGVRLLGAIVKKHLAESAGRRAGAVREAVPFV